MDRRTFLAAAAFTPTEIAKTESQKTFTIGTRPLQSMTPQEIEEVLGLAGIEIDKLVKRTECGNGLGSYHPDRFIGYCKNDDYLWSYIPQRTIKINTFRNSMDLIVSPTKIIHIKLGCVLKAFEAQGNVQDIFKWFIEKGFQVW